MILCTAADGASNVSNVARALDGDEVFIYFWMVWVRLWMEDHSISLDIWLILFFFDKTYDLYYWIKRPLDINDAIW